MEIYLDNSATTRTSEKAAAAMNLAMKTIYGNPSSLHRKGVEAEKVVVTARKAIAEAINAEPSEIIFTSGGTESNNLGIRGFLDRNRRNGKHIITSSIEHPSILNLFKHLESEYEASYLPVDGGGHVSVEELKAEIGHNTALASIMAVNNEIGSLQPIEAIGNAIKEKNEGTVFHVDAVQAIGKMDIDVKKMRIDMLSGSGHKFHGPKGIGFLYVRNGLKLNPLIYGGNQEKGLRSGTENVPAIAGMGEAAVGIVDSMKENISRMALYKKSLVEAIRRELNDFLILSDGDGYSPNIVNVCFENVKAEVLLHSLEQDGIYVSSGSACSSKKRGSSHVLEAINVPKTHIGGAVRISFTWENEISEIEPFIESLKRNVAEIQRIMKRK